MNDITNLPVEVDRRGWHYAYIESFELYGNRYIGPEGEVYWSTSVARDCGRVKHYWISRENIRDVSTYLFSDLIRGVAENISSDERTAISSAIATWEKKLTEHDRRLRFQ
jgi:hypothetical protein